MQFGGQRAIEKLLAIEPMLQQMARVNIAPTAREKLHDYAMQWW